MEKKTTLTILFCFSLMLSFAAAWSSPEANGSFGIGLTGSTPTPTPTPTPNATATPTPTPTATPTSTPTPSPLVLATSTPYPTPFINITTASNQTITNQIPENKTIGNQTLFGLGALTGDFVFNTPPVKPEIAIPIAALLVLGIAWQLSIRKQLSKLKMPSKPAKTPSRAEEEVEMSPKSKEIPHAQAAWLKSFKKP